MSGKIDESGGSKTRRFTLTRSTLREKRNNFLSLEFLLVFVSSARSGKNILGHARSQNNVSIDAKRQ